MSTQVTILIAVISVLCTIIGVIIGFLTFSRNRDKDVKSEAKENAVISTKLDTISAGVQSIQIDLKANEKKVSELSEKFVAINESVKSLHRRVDKMEDIKGGIGSD